MPRPRLIRERLSTSDDDFIDLDWTDGTHGPVVIVLHGLEGSAESPYARGMLDAVHHAGWRGVLMHFRGCSGEPNRRDRSYHSGDTGDIDALTRTLCERDPLTPFAVVGFSLGGNVLLKWLAELGAETRVAAAVAVSVPFLLGEAAQRLNQGFSRTYQWLLLRNLHNKLRLKFRDRRAPIDLGQLTRWRTFESFDHHVTAKLHGFAGVDDYYRRASSRQYLAAIETPTLIVHARDDPFMTPKVIPTPRELSPTTQLEVSRTGGHVGFVAGTPWRPSYWLEGRTMAFLKSVIRDSGLGTRDSGLGTRDSGLGTRDQ